MRSRHIQRMQRRAHLLGPDGQPIAREAKEGVPFIQWLPNGKSVGRTIDRGEAVNAQAERFIDRGGRYSFVIDSEGVGVLVAGFPVKDGAKGEMIVVAEERAPDGPSIPPAVDHLVAASVANMDAVILGESRAETVQ